MKKFQFQDRETLKKVAMISMRSKAVGPARDYLAEIAIYAVKQISEKRGDSMLADIDNIQIVKKEGKSILDTTLVKGIILDKEVVHAGMPKRIEKAKIALLNAALEVEKTEISAEIRIRDLAQMKAFLDQETSMLREIVEKIAATSANVFVCQKGIDDMAQHFLAKHGVLSVRRAKESDMEKLSRATGGKVVTNIDDLKPEDLGHADIVEERKIGDDKMTFVEGCKDPRSVSLLIRAGLERMVDEAERAMKDALSVVADVVEKNKIVAGGGAIEAEIAKELHKFASKVGGREQMAISGFADTMEVIPKALSDNAGLESIDVLVNLRAAHEKPKGQFMGVDVFSGKIVDMYEEGVLEPLSVKEHAVKSAAEAASMILRIDDIIAASKPKQEKGQGSLPEGGEY